MRLYGSQIGVERWHIRHYLIGNPTRQRHAGLLNRSCSQQRMIDAAEPHAHHQNHRQTQPRRQIGHAMLRIQRHEPTARPLHHDNIGLRLQRATSSHYFIQLYRHARPASSNVGCNRRFEAVRIHPRWISLHTGCGYQLFNIAPIRHAVTPVTTGSNRLHANTA